ncbi:hypothetical protein BC936DRAFT_139713 [Jimgerdemannia flammicorona]|uniref:Uncharacterized protein n=1 Tax=Jimgerdemannia flammicorona TaxID=994334 RepID=A0A433B9E6_9FUNG|nr:hypothetical protein BC936DRAFT_139713 [Jimgerdemannia flammicorona]
MKQDIYQDFAILTAVMGVLGVVAFVCWEVYKKLVVNVNEKLKEVGFEMRGNVGSFNIATKPDEDYLEKNKSLLTKIWDQRPLPDKPRWYLMPRKTKAT